MYNQLSEKFSQVFKKLRGNAKLTPENMQATLRDIRLALLEADVALPVVKQFLEKVRIEAEGQNVLTAISPAQTLIKIVHDILVKTLGEVTEPLSLASTPPAVILLAGLQGAGKTTTAAKLAKFIKENHKKKILLASVDVYRPAAVQQLAQLAAQIGMDFYSVDLDKKPAELSEEILQHAKRQFYDVVIMDTAGRTHIDAAMMEEIVQLHKILNPAETLFVLDSMTGQDAANTAKTFNEHLPLTGVILTKTDGDARGGAALSVKEITQKPIKFIGLGEKLDAFQVFHPERIASRILDMGDIVSLVEAAEKHIDKKDAIKMGKKIKKGQFDLADFQEQLAQMSKLGGISGIMKNLPGMQNLPTQLKDKFNTDVFARQAAILNSMTRQEKQFPALIKHSRKNRIAKGSGTSVQEVNKLLRQFEQMQKMMKKLTRGGNMQKMLGKMMGMPGASGGMPGMLE